MTVPLQDDTVDLAVSFGEEVFSGAVWNVRRERFAFAGEEITREFVDHTGAVAVLALGDDERVCLIKQYRHPIRAREWELPAGLLDFVGESPLAAAKRELAEEADLIAGDWSLLSDYHTSPGGSSEALRIFLARDLSATPEAFDRRAEEAELEKHWYTLDAIVDAVLERRVQNSVLVVAALTAQASRARGWSTLADAETPWLRHPSARTI